MYILLKLDCSHRGQEYENSVGEISKISSPNGARILKCLRDVEKLYSSQGEGQWSNNAVTLLERALAEINRILDKKVLSFTIQPPSSFPLWLFYR